MEMMDSTLEINENDPFDDLETIKMHKVPRGSSLKQINTNFEKNNILEEKVELEKSWSCPWLKITPASLIKGNQTNLVSFIRKSIINI